MTTINKGRNTVSGATVAGRQAQSDAAKKVGVTREARTMNEPSVSGEHTPGPWIVFVGRSRSSDAVIFTILPAGRAGEIASTIGNSADAALIASAPDMLAALKQIHFYETVRDPNRGELFLGALAAVEAAIAKATGGQP